MPPSPHYPATHGGPHDDGRCLPHGRPRHARRSAWHRDGMSRMLIVLALMLFALAGCTGSDPAPTAGDNAATAPEGDPTGDTAATLARLGFGCEDPSDPQRRTIGGDLLLVRTCSLFADDDRVNATIITTPRSTHCRSSPPPTATSSPVATLWSRSLTNAATRRSNRTSAPSTPTRRCSTPHSSPRRSRGTGPATGRSSASSSANPTGTGSPG